ncbi:MAG: T9SS type A sorting domain-containing protein [Flavobacteriales bacterium]|nr:T9SS type A sorting domain-containing protein [Flavobacteriales bacterium]
MPGVNSTTRFYNVGEPLTYYYTNFDPVNVPLLNFNVNSIQLNQSAFENQCSNWYLNDPNDELEQLLNDLDNQVSEFENLIDGGDTDDLTLEIINSTYSEAIVLSYNLLSKSPYLSKEATLKVIDKEMELPNSLLHEILMANTWAIKDVEIRNRLESKIIPFTEYEKQLLATGLEIVNAKESLIASISNTNLEIERILNHTISEITSTSDAVLQLEEFIEILEKYKSSRKKTIALCALSDFEATDVDLELDLGIPSNDLSQTDQQYLIATQEFNNFLNGAETLTTSMVEPTGILTARINNIAEIQEKLYGYETGPLEIQNPKNQFVADVNKEEQVSVYPNPSSGLVNIVFSDSPSNQIFDLEVFDLQGRKVQIDAFQSSGNSMVLELDVPSGVYQIRIYSKQHEILATTHISIL